jgi:hypothetical protein
LQVDWLLDLAGVDQIGQVVDHAHIVDLELRFGSVLAHQLGEFAYGNVSFFSL